MKREGVSVDAQPDDLPEWLDNERVNPADEAEQIESDDDDLGIEDEDDDDDWDDEDEEE